MDFLSLAQKRYSCRSYKPAVVEDATLRRILEAMQLAPSACNRQPYRLYVLKTEQYRDVLHEIYPQPWFVEAPIVVGIVAYLDRAWCHRDGKNLGLVDAAIAFDHLLLAAAAEGLGTCWVASFNRPRATELLKVPEGAEIVAFSPLGVPGDLSGLKQRKPIDTLVHFGAP